MTITTESIVNLGFKAVDIIMWIIAFIILLRNRVASNAAKKALDKEYNKALKNKGEQTAREEEIKDMAKFLCDLCGAETKVKEGQSFTPEGATEALDLCPTCYERLTARSEALKEAQAEYDAAVANLERARLKLLDLTHSDKEQKIDPAAELKQTADQIGTDAVLEALGLKR